jgi:oxygen-independent coproporphyrinogen-3 oxidase
MMITNNHNDNAIPGNPLGLYLHIPFCIKKCSYCDFLSFGGTEKEVHATYVKALVRDIEQYGELYRNKYYVDTIFIGGGTPSLIDEDLMVELAQAIKDRFDVAEDVEFTIESNPKTLTEGKLDTYLNLGINRLSIGAQSFDDGLLSYMGRIHSSHDILNQYELARKCGFQNINLDLMSAIPGQSMEMWLQTMDTAMTLKPEHISFYSLQLEEGTPFFSMFEAGSLKEIDDELDRSMYHESLRRLKENGYHHYEISNAALTGRSCRHNLKYWSFEDYLGLGLGAHSFVEGMRFSKITDLDRYIKNPQVEWEHKNTREDNISEYMITGMRKMSGIDMEDFKIRFKMPLESLFGELLKKYQNDGLIDISDGWLCFTEKGIDISNKVLAEFV